MDVAIEKCELHDVAQLQKISIDTFYETFKDDNTTENMDAYLEKAFNMKQLEKELSNPSTTFYFAKINDQVAGYLKINVDNAQSEPMGDTMLEIERIYIDQHFQKHGIGKLLLQKAIDTAKQLNKEKVWLGVWEKNDNAIAFYERMGFVKNGSHTFYLGDDAQVDYIMVKSLR